MRKTKMFAAAILAAVTMAMAPMSASAAFGLPAKTQTQAEDSYVFKSGAVEIKMGEEAKTVLAQLGNPVKPVFEIDSCAYQGKDKVYSYKYRKMFGRGADVGGAGHPSKYKHVKMADELTISEGDDEGVTMEFTWTVVDIWTEE